MTRLQCRRSAPSFMVLWLSCGIYVSVANVVFTVFVSCSVEMCTSQSLFFFFFQAEDGIRDLIVTGVQTCALPIYGLFEEFRKALLDARCILDVNKERRTLTLSGKDEAQIKQVIKRLSSAYAIRVEDLE